MTSFGLLERTLIAPSFLIIGSQKAATTSLHYYLKQHPLIKTPKQKEIRFFCVDKKYKKGVEHYHSFFKFKSRHLETNKPYISFEATPENMYFPYCAERIKAYNPDIKLIVSLRNPVNRAYSAWNMLRELRHFDNRFGPIKPLSRLAQSYRDNIPSNFAKVVFHGEYLPSFEELVALEMQYIKQNKPHFEPSILRRGFYLEQLKNILKYFKREQLLILETKELKQDLPNQLNKILNFVGIENYDWTKADTQVKHKRTYLEPMQTQTKERLEAFYKPYNEALFDFLGNSYDW